MPQVYTSDEYEKCLKEVLKRAKIGKDVYDKACVAKCEAEKGKIQTVNHTGAKEDRIPQAEKYDLPGDYRLVVQRVEGSAGDRVFLFVGNHEETEKWLNNPSRRKFRWSPPKQPPKSSSELKSEQLLKKTQSENQRLEQEKEQLKAERDAERQRNLQAEEQRQSISQNVPSQDSVKPQAEEQPTIPAKNAEAKQSQIEADPLQPIIPAPAHAEEERPTTVEASRKEDDWKQSPSGIAPLSTPISKFEPEDRSFRQQQGSTAAKPRPNQQTGKLPKFLGNWGTAIGSGAAALLVIGLLDSALSKFRIGTEQENPYHTKTYVALPPPAAKVPDLLVQSESRPEQAKPAEFKISAESPPPAVRPPDPQPSNQSRPEKEKQAEIKIADAPRKTVIAPGEVSRWEGQEATVRVVVKSTHDSFDWAFMVNSEADFKHPENFTVVVERESAGVKYKQAGVSNLSQLFKKNTVLLVTGKIEQYTDKRTGRVRYQLRVKDPEQIRAE